VIPIHILTANGPLPVPPPAADGNGASETPQGICYVLAKNGVYKQVSNAFYTAQVKVDGIGHLEEAKESVAVHVPKLPIELLRQVEAFFAAAYEAFQSEAVVVLLVNPVTRQWRIDVPKQEVRSGSLHVTYDPASVAPQDGFEPFGTIHSHAGATAFHSSTDDHDEVCSDGLHITIGNLDQPVRSYAARWMICGHAYGAKLEAVVETPPLPASDPAWLGKISQAYVPQDTSLLPPEEPWGPPYDPRLADDPDIPPELEAEYDEFMYDAHERFKSIVARR